jgi:hypothetical protein
MNRITITAGGVSLPAELYDSPTPASTDERPRAYSPVNLLGRVIGDATRFRAVKGGAHVRLTREGKS